MGHQRNVVLAGVWLGVLAVGGALLVSRIVRVPPSETVVDTKIVSGDHVIFVLVAPSGIPNDEYVGAVQRARAAFRDFAVANDYFFSTVGVSNHSNIEYGLSILEHLGVFDELNVGRNWFNSGLTRYVMDMGAPNELPQVVGILETIKVHSTGWTSLRRVELGRFTGPDQLSEWERCGFPISIETGHLVFPEDE